VSYAESGCESWCAMINNCDMNTVPVGVNPVVLY